MLNTQKLPNDRFLAVATQYMRLPKEYIWEDLSMTAIDDGICPVLSANAINFSGIENLAEISTYCGPSSTPTPKYIYRVVHFTAGSVHLKYYLLVMVSYAGLSWTLTLHIVLCLIRYNVIHNYYTQTPQ